jgi:hypothetical protein
MQDVGSGEKVEVAEQVEGELQVVRAKACLVVPSSLGSQTELNPRESTSESPSEAVRPVHTANLYGEPGKPTLHSSLSGVQ